MKISIQIKGGGKTKAKLAHLIKQLSKASNVEVGWNNEAAYDAAHRNGGLPVAAVAAINEWGGSIEAPGEPIAIKEHYNFIYRSIRKNGDFNRNGQFVSASESNFLTAAFVKYHEITIPARPFFRTMIAEKKGTYGPDIAKALEANDYDAKKALGSVGEKIQMELSKTIINWTEPPNAESTKKRKLEANPETGGDNPLEETGLMARTVNHWVG